jgi:outer membrane protein OmpA-like peptidoglycan-associated protein
VTALDEYQTTKSVTVNFKVASAVLSPEAKTALDEIATQAKNEKGYVIEVTGFASSEGKPELNVELSKRRSDAVVRYLAENHMIPLRRITMPFGYGAAQPVADNSTREGRQQNRRVEVKILSNRGLTASASPASTSETNSADVSKTAAPNQ